MSMIPVPKTARKNYRHPVKLLRISNLFLILLLLTMKKNIFLIFFLAIFILASSQEKPANRVYPTNWWVGMKNPALQLMIHGNNIPWTTVTINYPGVKLVKVHKTENPNYLFLDLVVSPAAKPGTFNIHLKY